MVGDQQVRGTCPILIEEIKTHRFPRYLPQTFYYQKKNGAKGSPCLFCFILEYTHLNIF